MNVEVSMPKIGWWKYAAAIALLSFLSILYFNINRAKPAKEIYTEKASVPEIQTIENDVVKEETLLDHEKIAHKRIQIHDTTFRRTNIKSESLPEIKSEIAENLADTRNKNSESIKAEEKPIVPAQEITQSDSSVPADAGKMIAKEKFYINADELLFGRELNKNKSAFENDEKRFGVIDLTPIKSKKPSSVKLMGITVYSDDNQ
ncbi:MAG: hypothetical protein K0M56_01665 [Kaistella sp.]|nr:hypothetical protein [Kaistella sp.]